MSQNPADWRSAVDAATGRTYWYHRKTRTSTWVKPDFCGEDLSGRESLNLTDSLLSRYSKTIKRIKSHPHTATAPELNWIMDTLHHSRDISEFFNPEYISEFIKLIELSVNLKLQHLYRTAMKCLCFMSRDRICAGRGFGQNTDWIVLTKLKGPFVTDTVSIMLLSCLFSNLLIGTTYSAVTVEMQQNLCENLSGLDMNENTAHNGHEFNNLMGIQPNNGQATDTMPVIDIGSIQFYTVLAELGHRLPATLLLVLSDASFTSEKCFTNYFVQRQGLQALACLSSSSLLDHDLRIGAKQRILKAMECSGYVRDQILSSLIDVGSDLGRVPVSIGPHPITCGSIDLKHKGATTTTKHQEYEELLHAGFLDMHEVITRDPKGNINNNNYEEELADWVKFNRDVEWM